MHPRDFQMVMSAVSRMLQELFVPKGEHGVAVTGSWSTQDDPAPPGKRAGTVAVTSGKTAAITGPDDIDADTGLAKTRVAVLSSAIGDQYFPRGNERVVMLPTETEPGGLYMHGYDDCWTGTLNPGERVIYHRNAAGVADAWIKFSNDGSSAGDGKGGLEFGFGELAEIETLGGHSIVLDDAGKKITLTTAGGLSLILDDNSGTIQHAGSGNAAADGLVRKSDLQAALNAYKAAEVAANVTNAGAIAVPTATASTKTFTA